MAHFPLPPAPSPASLLTLGPEGTFSDMATRRLQAAQNWGRLPIRYSRTLPEVTRGAEEDPSIWGVIPIENSVAGTVGQAQDSLLRHRVTIEHEILIKVRFSLLANGPLAAVRTCYTHPQAFDQCAEYLAAHLPGADPLFTSSNTASGQAFLARPADDPVAAIVPVEFGARHPQRVAGETIQDYPHNTTRFLLVRKAVEGETFDFGRAKTSLFVEPEEDRVGLLLDLLNVFSRHKINLCRLESRPDKTTPWVYVFFIDFTNTPATPACLDDLSRTATRIRVLGSYDTLE